MEVSLCANGELNHWPLVPELYFQPFTLPGRWVGPDSSNPSHPGWFLWLTGLKAVSVGDARICPSTNSGVGESVLS